MNIVEIEGHKVILDYLKSDSMVFDCGACVGEFTEKLNALNPCAFNLYEPDPRNYRRLKNRFKNNYRIVVFNIRIGKEQGKQEFYLGNYITASSFFKSHRGIGNNAVQVHMTTIEEELSVYGNIGLLKLDLEGSEIEAIPVIPEDTLSMIKQITVEFHPQSKIDGYTQEKIDICREHLKKQFNEIEYVDKGNDGHHGLYLNKEINY